MKDKCKEYERKYYRLEKLVDEMQEGYDKDIARLNNELDSIRKENEILKAKLSIVELIFNK